MKSDACRSLQSLTVAILAGGAATRLGGVDKGLMALNGRPLIAWVVESMDQNAAWPCLIVANRNSEDYSRYARTVGDRIKEVFGGPLAGVAAALSASESEWVFTVPVDSVRVNPMVASRLLQRALACNLDSAVAHDGRRRQPLFAIYRSKIAE